MKSNASEQKESNQDTPKEFHFKFSIDEFNDIAHHITKMNRNDQKFAGDVLRDKITITNDLGNTKIVDPFGNTSYENITQEIWQSKAKELNLTLTAPTDKDKSIKEIFKKELEIQDLKSDDAEKVTQMNQSISIAQVGMSLGAISIGLLQNGSPASTSFNITQHEGQTHVNGYQARTSMNQWGKDATFDKNAETFRYIVSTNMANIDENGKVHGTIEMSFNYNPLERIDNIQTKEFLQKHQVDKCENIEQFENKVLGTFISSKLERVETKARAIAITPDPKGLLEKWNDTELTTLYYNSAKQDFKNTKDINAQQNILNKYQIKDNVYTVHDIEKIKIDLIENDKDKVAAIAKLDNPHEFLQNIKPDQGKLANLYYDTAKQDFAKEDNTAKQQEILQKYKLEKVEDIEAYKKTTPIQGKINYGINKLNHIIEKDKLSRTMKVDDLTSKIFSTVKENFGNDLSNPKIEAAVKRGCNTLALKVALKEKQIGKFKYYTKKFVNWVSSIGDASKKQEVYQNIKRQILKPVKNLHVPKIPNKKSETNKMVR